MNNLEAKLDRYKSLGASSDKFAYLTDVHADYTRQHKIDMERYSLWAEIRDLGGMDQLLEIRAQEKAEEEARQARNDQARLERMYTEYTRLLETLSPDEADERMASAFFGNWEDSQEQVWERIAPEHRARKYAEQAIADSKLPEVC